MRRPVENHFALNGGVGGLNVFVVQSDDLLMLADHAGFAQRGQTMVDGKQIDACIRRTSLERGAALVAADQRDKGRVAAQGDNIGGRVRRAAKHPSGGVYPEHRYRGFRGNPAAVTEEVLVQNCIPEDEDALVVKLGHEHRSRIDCLVQCH